MRSRRWLWKNRTNGESILQGEFAGQGDGVFVVQAGEDFDAGDARDAELQGLPADLLARERVDAELIAFAAEGFLGDTERVVDDLREDEGVDVGAGEEFGAGVVDEAGDFADLAGVERDDLGGRLVDHAFPFAVGESVPGDANGESGADAAELGFVDVDDHFDAIDLADHGGEGSGSEPSAGAGFEAVDGTGEGGPDGGEFEAAAEHAGLGFGILQTGAGGVDGAAIDEGTAAVLELAGEELGAIETGAPLGEFLAGGGVLLDELLKALDFAGGFVAIVFGAAESRVDFGDFGGASTGQEEVQGSFGFIDAGIGGGELGAGFLGVEPGERRTLGNALTFADGDLGNQAFAFSTGGRPGDGFDFAVGGDGAFEALALSTREGKFGRLGGLEVEPKAESGDGEEEEPEEELHASTLRAQ